MTKKTQELKAKVIKVGAAIGVASAAFALKKLLNRKEKKEKKG
jgi:hypothetical protein